MSTFWLLYSQSSVLHMTLDTCMSIPVIQILKYVNSTLAAFFKEDTWVWVLEYHQIYSQVASEIWEKFEMYPYLA